MQFATTSMNKILIFLDFELKRKNIFWILFKIN